MRPANLKTVIVNDDGHGGFFTDAYAGIEGLEAFIEPYRGTTLTALEWGVCLGTKVNFLSDTFELFGTGPRTDLAHARRGDGQVARHLAAFRDRGIDPLDVVARKAHEAGIRLHVSLRVNEDYGAGWMGTWLPDTYNDTWYHDHPQLRITRRDGLREAHLSYAYPEVLERKIALAREVLRPDVDGISLDFLRTPPFVGYDPPLVDSFRASTGKDPRELPEDDRDWLRHRFGPMSDYVRAVRDLAGSRVVSARVDHRFALEQGLDVETWLREGWIDTLILAEQALGGYEFDLAPFVAIRERAGRGRILFGEEAVCTGHDLTPEEDRALAQGKKVDVSRRTLSLREYLERALRWYSQGADGVHIFNDPHNYEVLASIGDPEACRATLARLGPPPGGGKPG